MGGDIQLRLVGLTRSFLEHLSRSSILQSLVRPLSIVETQIGSNTRPSLRNALVRLQVHLLVFDTPPQPLHEHIVHLKAAGLVNAQGKVRDALRTALKDGTLTLPEPFAPQLAQVKKVLRKLAGRLEIKNTDERRQVKSR